MNIWARRTYFILFVLMFAVIATLLVFYAIGWRYDIDTRTLGKVGSLSLNSEPSNANVYLDGTILENKTPLSENNLIADEYRLSVYKEGYYDWQQYINIDETKTTFVPHVYLIKNQNLDDLYLELDITFYKFSNNNKLVAIESQNKLLIYNLEDSNLLYEQKITLSIEDISWNSNDTSLIYKDINGYSYVNYLKNETYNLNTKYQINATNFFWNKDEANIIYGLENKYLYRINKFQETIDSLQTNFNVLYADNDIFIALNEDELISMDQNMTILNSININSNALLTFDKISNDVILISDKNKSSGIYYNTKDNLFNIIDEKIDKVDFTFTNNLLHINSHEIWHINKDEEKNNLLLRTSENINQAYWLIVNQYIIYITDNNQIKISEINRPTNNTYEIDHELINSLERGYEENIFFLVNDLGIYKLEY